VAVSPIHKIYTLVIQQTKWDSENYVHVDGVRICLWTAATIGPTVCSLGDIRVWRATVERYWQSKTDELTQTWPSTTLSTTNPTWIDASINLGLCCEKLVSNHLSHGTPLAKVNFNTTKVRCGVVINHHHSSLQFNRHLTLARFLW
jgi:hypothetical protein